MSVRGRVWREDILYVFWVEIIIGEFILWLELVFRGVRVMCVCGNGEFIYNICRFGVGVEFIVL